MINKVSSQESTCTLTIVTILQLSNKLINYRSFLPYTVKEKNLHTLLYLGFFPAGLYQIEKNVIALLKSFTIKNVWRRSAFEENKNR